MESTKLDLTDKNWDPQIKQIQSLSTISFFSFLMHILQINIFSWTLVYNFDEKEICSFKQSIEIVTYLNIIQFIQVWLKWRNNLLIPFKLLGIV